MTYWQCAGCNTYNAPEVTRCDVCSGTARVRVPAPGPSYAPRTTRYEPQTAPAPPRWRWSPWIVLLAVLLAVVFGLTRWRSWHDTAAGGTPGGVVAVPGVPSSPAPTAGTRETAPPSASAAPVMVGIVDVSAVAADPRAPAVGRVLDVYFSGINAKDFTRALSVFDPAGVLNPGNPDHVGKFAHDDGTSVVSAVVVHGISDDPTRAGAVTVSTTFQSTQASGYGPRGRETETCTRWTVAYTFTASTGGVYLILRGDSQSAAC